MAQNIKNRDTMLSRKEIPIIDLGFEDSNQTLTNEQRREVAKQMNQAFTTNGCAFLINHGIKEEQLKALFKIMEEFCLLSDDVKLKYLSGKPPNYGGYIPPGMEKLQDNGLKEFKHTYNVMLTLSHALPTAEIHNFSEIVKSIIDDYVSLSKVIMEPLADALGVEAEELLSFHKGMRKEDNVSALRMLYYPPVGENPPPNITRCGEHSDFGSFTLLTQDMEGGLELLKDGEWKRIGHLPGAILMNIGDMMEMWSASKFTSAKHRVIIPEEGKSKGRYSIAFFVQPDNNTTVGPSAFQHSQAKRNIEDCINEKKYTAKEWFDMKLSKSRQV